MKSEKNQSLPVIHLIKSPPEYRGIFVDRRISHAIPLGPNKGTLVEREAQEVIRGDENELARFFPRVRQHELIPKKAGMKASGWLYSLSRGRRELVSRSFPVSGPQIPRKEISSLEASLKNLEAKKDQINLSETARMASERICLPDPDEDPQFYRLVGNPFNRKLIVLWGLETTLNSSLPADAAIEKLRKKIEPVWMILLRWLILILGVLLLASLLFYGWSQFDRNSITFVGDQSTKGPTQNVAAQQFFVVNSDRQNPMKLSAYALRPGVIYWTQADHVTVSGSTQDFKVWQFQESGNFEVRWVPDDPSLNIESRIFQIPGASRSGVNLPGSPKSPTTLPIPPEPPESPYAIEFNVRTQLIPDRLVQKVTVTASATAGKLQNIQWFIDGKKLTDTSNSITFTKEKGSYELQVSATIVKDGTSISVKAMTTVVVP